MAAASVNNGKVKSRLLAIFSVYSEFKKKEKREKEIGIRLPFKGRERETRKKLRSKTLRITSIVRGGPKELRGLRKMFLKRVYFELN